MTIVTVAQRRAAEVASLVAAVADITTELVDYGRANDVRFVLFGSFARGDFVASSDLDLMIAGPDERLHPARDYAEDACSRRGLRYDIYLEPEVGERLMMRIRRDGRELA